MFQELLQYVRLKPGIRNLWSDLHNRIILIYIVTLHFSSVSLLLRFVHPRFGPIKCIRTIRAIQKDEELTVAYGYDHEPSGKSGPEAPDWYKQELREFQEREAERKAKDSC